MSSHYEELQSINEQSLRRMTREESRELMDRAKELIFEEHASDMTRAQQEKIWARAWESGHSSGYMDVDIEFSDLVHWVREFQAL